MHFRRNALVYAGRSGRRVVAAFVATAFAAKAQWRQVADQIRPKLPKLATLPDEAEHDVLAPHELPPGASGQISLHQPLGTPKRRDQAPHRGIGIFFNEAAITRLIGAILLEQNDQWAVQRARYMTLGNHRALRDDLSLMRPAAAA